MEAAIRRLAGRVRLSIARAIVQLVNDSAKLQAVQVQVHADVVRDRAEHFQAYGLTSHPKPGAEGIALAIGGSTDHLAVVCVDDRRFRLTALAEGEVALYDDLGHKVHLTRTGIVIDGAGHNLTITNVPTVRIEGHVDCTGDITDRCDEAEGRTMAQMRATYLDHDHPETGATTGKPNQAV